MKKFLFVILIAIFGVNTQAQFLNQKQNQKEEYVLLVIETNVAVEQGSTDDSTTTMIDRPIVNITDGIKNQKLSVENDLFKPENEHFELYYLNLMAQYGWVVVEVSKPEQTYENVTFTDIDNFTIIQTFLLKREIISK